MAGLCSYCAVIFNVTFKIMFDSNTHTWYTVLLMLASALAFFPMFWIGNLFPSSLAYKDFFVCLSYPTFYLALFFTTFQQIPFEYMWMLIQSPDFDETNYER